MNCFDRDVSLFRGCFTWTQYPIFNPNLFFRIRYSPLQDVGNSGINLFIHAQVGHKNVNDVIHGKLQAEGGQMSRLGKNGKINVQGTSVQSPTRMSKMFLIVFVFGTGNMYFL